MDSPQKFRDRSRDCGVKSPRPNVDEPTSWNALGLVQHKEYWRLIIESCDCLACPGSIA